MSVSDPVAFLRNAHGRAEQLARAATPGPWEPEGDDPTDDEVFTVHDGEHGDWVGGTVAFVRSGAYGRVDEGRTQANMCLIADHASPDAVLRRVAAEQTILALHQPTWPTGEPEYDHHHETVIGEHGRTRYIEVRDDEPTPPYWCACCSTTAPCATLLALAAGWDWEAES